MKRILMIDDDESFLKIYAEILRSSGYAAETASSGSMGLALMEKELFDIVILDVVMPGMNGIEVLKRIKSEAPDQLVMMLTGEGSISGAVEAMEEGAYTYLIKPLEIDQLLLNVKRAAEFCRLNQENMQLKDQIAKNGGEMSFIGTGPSAEALREQIERVAPTGATVLITGESGTGKEIVADLLHQNSSQKDGPLIKVNCAALAESVLESELFGHEKGAFTGAVAMKPGRFELARGGTLFLDEIGEMPLPLQSKLLRVLQSKEFERVGGTRTLHVDFRLLAATNKNLTLEVQNGAFREDLYYRLNVIPIRTVPLREKIEDIPILLEHFLRLYCAEMKKPLVKLPEEAIARLKSYPWRGNIRELRNFAERLVVFSDGGKIGSEALSLGGLPMGGLFLDGLLTDELGIEDVAVQNRESGGVSNERPDWIQLDFQSAKDAFEREYLASKLVENQWNISVTAQRIGLARKNLQLKIKQFRLERPGASGAAGTPGTGGTLDSPSAPGATSM